MQIGTYLLYPKALIIGSYSTTGNSLKLWHLLHSIGEQRQQILNFVTVSGVVDQRLQKTAHIITVAACTSLALQ